MKKLFTLIFVGAALWLFFSSNGEAPAPSTQHHAHTLRSASAIIAPEVAPTQYAGIAPADCGITNAPALWQPRKDLYHAIETEIRRGIELNAYATLVNSQSSTEQLAAFTIAMKCSAVGGDADLSFISMDTRLKIGPEICASVGGGERNSPLVLLQQNRVLESPEVKLIAAKSAMLLARYVEFTGGEQDQAKAYLKMAEQLGHDAAVEGLEPALIFMAEHYDNGAFGEVQLAKAYTYVRKINDASPDHKGRTGFEYIYRKMTRTEFDMAESQIRNCRQPTHQSSPLRSPFGSG
ncbi:hypothetical protein NHH82_26615 [Oxalobacteraceae bacterium OTU3REALA1]|nr:hypothetical protein NHH82_26615 [Oxalobacteraceae bacterium OTU3REALA1]